jgi:archaellum component FlaC
MADIDVIKDDIEILRDKLMSLIRSKDDLLNPEVLEASMLLDNAINDYNRLCKRTQLKL